MFSLCTTAAPPPTEPNEQHPSPRRLPSPFFQFPRLRFAARSQLFWARNASLVSAVVSAVGEESRADCIRVLLEKAKAEQTVAAHEDKRSFDCAAAEVAAGVLAVLAGPSGWSERGRVVLRETVLPFVETALESVSLDGRLDWWDLAER